MLQPDENCATCNYESGGQRDDQLTGTIAIPCATIIGQTCASGRATAACLCLSRLRAPSLARLLTLLAQRSGGAAERLSVTK